MIIIATQDVPCDICGAERGEKCTYRYHAGGKHGRAFRFGCHSQRCRDAADVQNAANTLVDG